MDKIIPLLEQGGWFTHRRIDVSLMISDYIRQGFKEPNNFIRDFLSEFGNLKIEYKTADGLYYDIRINPEVGMEYIDVDDLPSLEKIVGDSLLPIGSINSDHLGFLVSFDGKFYLLGDEGIYYLGDEFLEVCKTIFLQEYLIKIVGR